MKKKIRHLPTKPPHTDTPKSVGIVSGAISSKPSRNVSFVSGNRRQTLLQVIHAQNSHFLGERELFVKCQFDIATTLYNKVSAQKQKKSKSFNLSSSSVHFSSDYTPLTYSMASSPCDLLPFDWETGKSVRKIRHFDSDLCKKDPSIWIIVIEL